MVTRPAQDGLRGPLRLVVAGHQLVDVGDRIVLAAAGATGLVEHREGGDVVQRLGSSGCRELCQRQRSEHIGVPQRLVAAQEVHGSRRIGDGVHLFREPVPALGAEAEPWSAQVTGHNGHPAPDFG